MTRSLYYAGCFLAAAALASVPRLLIELQRPLPLFDRALLLGLAVLVAWFFTHTLHENWRWSVLSSVFLVESVTAVVFAVLLFLQLFSPLFAYLSLFVLLAHAFVLGYVLSYRITHLRGLVYATLVFFFVAGELVITFGTRLF